MSTNKPDIGSVVHEIAPVIFRKFQVLYGKIEANMWSIKCTDKVLQADLWICSYEWGALFNSLQLELFPHFYSPVLELVWEGEKNIQTSSHQVPNLRGVEWVHCLFLFPLVLGKMQLSHAKLGLFLCSLDTLLQKNVIVFFFGNPISKWRSFIFGLFFTFFSHQGKVAKIPSASISLTYIHIFCSPYWLFCLTNCEKNTNLSGMVSLWCDSCVDSYSCHFGTINK